MPIQVTYPGVYLQELPGGQPVVPGVSTSVTAFVDFFTRGPMGKAVQIFNMDDFNRTFGGLNLKSEASYAIQQYFTNGGQQAWVVRTGDGTAKKAMFDVPLTSPGLAARYQWATEYTNLADKAQKAARDAADKAHDALGPPVNEKDLQSQSTMAAQQTEEAAEATRNAAQQAADSSDELAVAISRAVADAGPVNSYCEKAASASADAAKASKDASQANVNVIHTAQDAETMAGVASEGAQTSRPLNDAAQYLQETSDAIDAALTENVLFKTARDEPEKLSSQESLQVVQEANEAGEQAKIAVDSLQLAIKAANSSQDVTDLANSVLADVRTIASASWNAEIASSEQAAQQAAHSAATALEDAQSKLKGSTGTIESAALDVLNEVLDAAKLAAENASYAITGNNPTGYYISKDGSGLYLMTDWKEGDWSAWGDQGGLVCSPSGPSGFAGPSAPQGASAPTGPPTPPDAGTSMEETIDSAICAIQQAYGATNLAITDAREATSNANSAADSVGSTQVDLANHELGMAAEKMSEATAVLADAKVVAGELSQAQTTAMDSAKLASDKAKSVTPATALDDKSLQLAQDTAQAALGASESTLAASESVEKALTSVSSLTVEAAQAADVAAQAARVAVMATEEAGRQPTLRIMATNEGLWGNNLRFEITPQEDQGGQTSKFLLTVEEWITTRGVPRKVNSEFYSQLTLEANDPHNAVALVNDQSHLVSLDYIGPRISGASPQGQVNDQLKGGTDGGFANAGQLTGSGGLQALDNIAPAIFNILCLPVVAKMTDAKSAIGSAQQYCQKHRAFYIVDIPESVNTVDKMEAWVRDYSNADAFNMAVYFPRLSMPDPLQDYRPRSVGASGTMAGIYARTDAANGVWKAPAGINAVLRGADITVNLDDTNNGLLNVAGVNVLRSFPIYGNISWGGRTLAGADLLNSEWKYISTRRLMYYVEESLYQSLKWAVFEANDDILWGKIRVQVGSFLSELFADGAFAGATPEQAYFVTCDGTTTSTVDIDLGIVNVNVGIAPAKPAEFIVLTVQQITGQTV